PPCGGAERVAAPESLLTHRCMQPGRLAARSARAPAPRSTGGTQDGHRHRPEPGPLAADLAPDPAKLDAFIGRFLGDVGALMTAATVLVGERLGLWRARAEGGPTESVELARRTGTAERATGWRTTSIRSGACTAP